MRALLFSLFIFCIVFSDGNASAQDLANQHLPNAAQEAEASKLMHRLRCIQCQGQSIADSDAPIAGAMRREVRARIAKGKSAAEIESWLVQRYGDYVSFDPPMRGLGLWLWLLPAVIFGFGVWSAGKMFRASKS